MADACSTLSSTSPAPPVRPRPRLRAASALRRRPRRASPMRPPDPRRLEATGHVPWRPPDCTASSCPTPHQSPQSPQRPFRPRITCPSTCLCSSCPGPAHRPPPSSEFGLAPLILSAPTQLTLVCPPSLDRAHRCAYFRPGLTSSRSGSAKPPAHSPSIAPDALLVPDTSRGRSHPRGLSYLRPCSRRLQAR